MILAFFHFFYLEFFKPIECPLYLYLLGNYMESNDDNALDYTVEQRLYLHYIHILIRYCQQHLVYYYKMDEYFLLCS